MPSRVRVTWSGPKGTPGVTTFFGDGGTVPNIAALQTFFTAIRTFIPTGYTLQVENQGDFVDDGTGELTGTWSAAAQSAIATSGTGGYAAPVGMQVTWLTEGIHNGRRLRGRTFLVPFTALGTDGQYLAGAVTALSDAANALRNAAGPKFGVWGRPTFPPTDPAAPAGTPRPAPVTQGLWSPWTAHRVTNKPVVLRSRRD